MAYSQAYIDKYDFEHEVITGAVDEKANVTFSFWQDKVRPGLKLGHGLGYQLGSGNREYGVFLWQDKGGAALLTISTVYMRSKSHSVSTSISTAHVHPSSTPVVLHRLYSFSSFNHRRLVETLPSMAL